MGQNHINYSVYVPGAFEKIISIFLGSAAGIITGYTFYENWILSVLTAAAGGILALKIYRNRKIEGRKTRLLLQFRDMLGSLSGSLSAGANVQAAFSSAEEDMTLLHGEDSYIVNELAIINTGISGNINVEQLLCDFGDRSGIEDIRSFACVFETCFRLGGNIKEIVSMTCAVICDKIDTQQEIVTVVSAKKTEQNAMLVMPVVFILLLKGASAGVADLTSARGIVSTTIAVAMFAAAYLIGKKILKIEF